MNWFDVITGILLLVALVNGYRKGLIKQLVGLASIVLAAVFGGKLAERILPEVNQLIDVSPNVARVISFVLAFALIAIIISLIGRLLQKFIDVVFLNFFNRLLGGVVAIAIMTVFLSIILNLVLMLDKSETVIQKEVREESFFFERVEAVVPAIVPYLNKELWDEYVPEDYRKEIENKPDSILRSIPGAYNIDSTFQHQHFKID